jgi:ABC-type lipoprotein release transport system permease subunit
MSHLGYSGTPLPKKLGLKDGHVAAFCGLPDSLADLTRAVRFIGLDAVEDYRDLSRDNYDFIHLFTKQAHVVDQAVPVLRQRVKKNGMIWVSWPKKASKVETDVTEDVIRNRALADILVDVKVCAIDHVWSGLKLMIRKEKREALV